MNINWNDLIFFVGIVSFTTGLWLYSPAVSLTLTGVIFMLTGYMRAGGDQK